MNKLETIVSIMAILILTAMMTSPVLAIAEVPISVPPDYDPEKDYSYDECAEMFDPEYDQADFKCA